MGKQIPFSTKCLEKHEGFDKVSFVFQIYKVKDKKHKEDEVHSNKKQDKELLLWLVKIFHADPVFAFNVSLMF